MKLVVKSDTEIELYMDVISPNMDLTSKRAVITGSGYSNASIMFAQNSSSSGNLSFDNIVINYGSETMTEDYETSKAVNLNLLATDGIDIKGLSVLEFNAPEKNARIMNNKPIVVDPNLLDTDTVFELSFDMDYKTNEQGARIGVILGADSKDTYPTTTLSETNIEYASSAIYTIHSFTGALYDYNAQGVRKTKNNGFDILHNDGVRSFKITVLKSGAITITDNGNEVTVNGGYPGPPVAFDAITDISGYFGFIALDNSVDTGALDVQIDNVVAKNYTRKKITSKSLSNNFSSNYLGNSDNPDYFITSDPANSLKIANGKLNYDGASDGTFFGLAYEYDDFVLEYEVCDVFVGTDSLGNTEKSSPNKWLGLNFARKNFDSTNYMYSPMVYFYINPAADNTSLMDVANLPVGGKVNNIKPIPKSLWDAIQYDGETIKKTDIKSADTVKVKWVAEDNVLSLYLKKASDKSYTLYATVTGADTTGYVAICNTGFTYASLDNLTMTNNSKLYEIADISLPEDKECELVHVDPNNPGNNSEYVPDINLDKELEYLDSLKDSGGCSSNSVGLVLTLTVALGFVLINRKA